MHTADRRVPGGLAQAIAFARLAWCYCTTVSQLVERELDRWRRRAQAIPDPDIRGHALAKLRDAGSHAWLNATFASSAPRAHRREAVVASVALEVLYDHLDTLSERAGSLAQARTLLEPFARVFREDVPAPPDETDGAYVRDLALAARASFRALPASAAVAPVAARVAGCCADAQSHCHQPDRSTFERWAERQPFPAELEWWEGAAGWSGGVIGAHALIALAARERTTSAEAAQLAAAYERICPLATLLDSLADRDEDRRSGGHSYVGYYASDAVMSARIAAVARSARTAAATTTQPAQHALTVTGIAGFYLSEPTLADEHAVAKPTIRALGSAFPLLLLAFRILRRYRRARFRPVEPKTA